MAIVPHNPGGAPEPIKNLSGGLLGWEEFDTEVTIQPASLKLLQPTNADNYDGGVSGQFYDDLMQKSIPGPLQVQIVRPSFSRVKFLKDSNPPVMLCRSNDNRVPTPRFAEERAKEFGIPASAVRCETCPHAAWHEDEDGKKSTGCRKNLDLIVVLPEEFQGDDGAVPARMASFHGKSFGPLMTYLKQIRQRGLNSFAYFTTFETEKVTGGMTPYFVLKPKLGDRVKPEQFAAAQAFLTHQADAFKQATDKAAEEAVAEEAPATAPPSTPPAEADPFDFDA